MILHCFALTAPSPLALFFPTDSGLASALASTFRPKQSSRQHTQEIFWPIQGLKPEGPRFSLPCSSHQEGLMCHRNEFKAQKCTETRLPLLCPHLVHTHSRYSGVNTSACLGLGERWGKSWNFPKWYLMNGKHFNAPCSGAQGWRGMTSSGR